MGHGEAGGSHDRRRVRAGNAQHHHGFGLIGGARQTRRHGPLQDRQRALTPFQRHGEAHARTKACGPAIHDDHAFGREQRAVDECSVARVFNVAGEQALETGHRSRAGAGEIDDSGLGRRHDRPRAQLIDDLGRHLVVLEAHDCGSRCRGKRVGHSAASSAALCPENESHTKAAPRPPNLFAG